MAHKSNAKLLAHRVAWEFLLHHVESDSLDIFPSLRDLVEALPEDSRGYSIELWRNVWTAKDGVIDQESWRITPGGFEPFEQAKTPIPAKIRHRKHYDTKKIIAFYASNESEAFQSCRDVINTINTPQALQEMGRNVEKLFDDDNDPISHWEYADLMRMINDKLTP